MVNQINHLDTGGAADHFLLKQCLHLNRDVLVKDGMKKISVDGEFKHQHGWICFMLLEFIGRHA